MNRSSFARSFNRASNCSLKKSGVRVFTTIAAISIIAFACSEERNTKTGQSSSDLQSSILLKNREIQPHALKGTEKFDTDQAFDLDLYILQLEYALNPSIEKKLIAEGVEFKHYLPERAYVVRLKAEQIKAVSKLDIVRHIEPLRAPDKADPAVQDLMSLKGGEHRLVIVPYLQQDKQALFQQITDFGGEIIHHGGKSLLFEAFVDEFLYEDLLASPQVLWVEEWSEPDHDMDLARAQSGLEDVRKAIVPSNPEGYTGVGIRGHVMEGVYKNHTDFQKNDYREAPVGLFNGDGDSHGHATYGIVFGDGTGDKRALGILPNAQGFYTHYRYVYSAPPGSTDKGSRYEVVKEAIDKHEVMFQTASWGFARTRDYTARSAEMDQIIFDLDIPITQSQSNAGNPDSRPQAWAKNIISVGGFRHQNTASKTDDAWARSGSTGPAKDGRIKPDVSAYYDLIHTTAQTGYRQFGGTSGATPIVAGHVGIILEMWTNGIFGNKLLYPETERFKNRPHASTVKALLINSAEPYAFDSETHDMARTHQGWGYPDVKNLYDGQGKIEVVNESVLLKAGETADFNYDVADKEPRFKATLVYQEPPASLTAKKTLINDLHLKVTSPSGKVYWGNYGLQVGNVSLEGGQADVLNNVENVFIDKPETGKWTVEVIANEVNMDNHVETAEVDMDFALVVSGVQR